MATDKKKKKKEVKMRDLKPSKDAKGGLRVAADASHLRSPSARILSSPSARSN